jgi:hypothetical protein
MKPWRVVLLVFGSLIALIALALLGAGAGLVWALNTQRDDAGFFTTSDERFESDSYAITSDEIDLGDPGPDDWWAEQDLATVRVRADNAGEGELFVGIGPEADVEAYLAGVPHDEVVDLDDDPFSVEYRRENASGSSTPAPPADETFWVAQASGVATETVTWSLEPGRWAIVVMNGDASPEVSADIEIGARIEHLVALAVGLLIGGAVLLAAGAAMIVGGVVGAAPKAGPEVSPASATAPTRRTSPVRIEGQLDADLSRWRWLVKWLLAFPHFVVLALLWVAFVVLTIVAFFAILFTGRYPRSIFDFNVGVLRWTWRVSYYSTSAIGTDRYPPFTLGVADYPATLDIVYPERLSRGLVVVKSWLLAIPHLVIVGILTATWTFGGDEGRSRFVLSGGLIGVLVLIAAFTLLVTGRYPLGLYDLIMGLNRWVYRVLVYVALMSDEYPPFHLDQGGVEPIEGRLPPPTSPTSPTSPTEKASPPH